VRMVTESLKGDVMSLLTPRYSAILCGKSLRVRQMLHPFFTAPFMTMFVSSQTMSCRT
jgi:hypothetical protein